MKIDSIAQANGWSKYDLIKFAGENYSNAFKDGMRGPTIDDGVVDEFVASFREYYEKLSAERIAIEEKKRRLQEFEEKLKAGNSDILLSTTNSLEGYRVVEYLGLVFGETIYKASLADTIGAALDNFASSLSFSAIELSSSVKLQENARQFALGKLQMNAVKMGANAVIGIDTDNTVGSSLAYLSIHGTAVRVEKIQ